MNSTNILAPSSSSTSSSTKNYSCSICKFTFSANQRLWEHNKKFHPEVASGNIRQGTLKCGICASLFKSQRDLCQHISNDHSTAADIQGIRFESVQAFNSWKESEESKRKCYFSKSNKGANVSKTTGIRTEYYFCHR